MFTLDNNVWEVEDYLEELGYERNSLTLEEVEDLVGEEYWNYPLSEITHCIENGGNYAIVRFENIYSGYDYRICEL